MNMYPNFAVGGMGYGLPMPYQTPISPALSNGTQIHVTGTPTGDRFAVNLKNQQEDIVLHFNPRLSDGTMVLNSAQRGAWGQEQRQSLPFQRGVRFTMAIVATDHSFKITVNNSHLCEFVARTPMYLAQTLEVTGDINLESAQVFSGAMNFPQMGMNMPYGQPQQQQQPFGGGFGFTSTPVVVQTPSFAMGGAVPSIQSCRINVGSRIFVRGFIPPGANRFELNLLQGFTDNDDIAFHFNPRFDGRKIVKNHRRNGHWGQEENQPFPSYMPLMPGTQIDLQITCNPDKYTVFMNNQLIAEYSHKTPPGSVMALQYKGDLTVTSVGQL